MKETAILFVRADPAEHNAIDRMEDLRAVASRKGWNVCGEQMCRKHLFGLLRDCKEKSVDHLLIERLSQLSRKRWKLIWMLRFLTKHGVQVETADIQLGYYLYRHGITGG